MFALLGGTSKLCASVPFLEGLWCFCCSAGGDVNEDSSSDSILFFRPRVLATGGVVVGFCVEDILSNGTFFKSLVVKISIIIHVICCVLIKHNVPFFNGFPRNFSFNVTVIIMN